MGIVCCVYSIWNNHYPSDEQNSIGRYTTSILTSIIMLDCSVLLIFSVDISTFDGRNWIYNIYYVRLFFHNIHIFGTSLFFIKNYNFYFFAYQWLQLMWLSIVSYNISSPQSIDIMYLIVITIKFCSWMIPMM